MFIGNLPEDTSENSLTSLFSGFGTVRSVRIANDPFTGRCKGFGFVEMEGHEARNALAALDGKLYQGKNLRVRFEDATKSGRRRKF